MNVKGIVWVGSATERYDETVRFFKDTMGLETFHEQDDLSILRLATWELTTKVAVTTSQTVTPAANARCGVVRQANNSNAPLIAISTTVGSSGTRPLNHARPTPVTSIAPTSKRASSVGSSTCS